MPIRRTHAPLLFIAVPALALAGCSSTQGAESGSSDAFRIVTSTTVYADLAGMVAGDAAEVEAVIDSAAVDPHDYEATARDGLTVRDADLVILNGGGYDQFMVDLVGAADVEHVLTAIDFSHAEGEGAHEHADEAAEDEHGHDEHSHDEHGHIAGFNEHVWYDPHTMAHVVEGIEAELIELIPDAADEIAAGADAALSEIEALEGRLADIAADHTGETVFLTEPIGGYLAEAAGLDDVTVDGFAEAVEHGEGVSPAILNDALKAVEGGDVSVLIANAQTGGAETERVMKAAEDAGVPVVEFTESIPDGSDYITWMTENATALEQALR